MKLVSNSTEETVSMGYEFAKELKAGDIVGLFGNLGSGKTQFVKGICKFFGVNDNVSSPTFIIVNEYKGKQLNINHFDLYRIKNISDLKEIGIDNYINNNSICLIEWAELVENFFKEDLRKVFFEYGNSELQRVISF